MRRSVLAAAVGAGVLAGAAGAAVRADQRTPAAARVPAHASAGLPPVDARPLDRTADGRYKAGYVHYRVHGVRVAVQAADPAGGPDWAVETFDAERITLERPARTLAGGRVVGRERCAQLGRIENGRFGWIYGDGRFHALGVEDQLLECTSRKRPQPLARLATALTIADPAAPALAATAIWGLADGPVTVAGTGAGDGPAANAGGAFLRVAGPDARPLAGARVQAGGRSLRLAAPGSAPASGTETIEARAPDPSGGPGYGIAVAKTADGRTCVGSATQVAGGRPGGVDLRLGLFSELAPTCRPFAPALTRARPCSVTTGFGNAEELEGDDTFLRQARVERRLLAGRTTITAQCMAGVDRVTVRTPRDTRTLVPSPIAHLILAVYDGDFPNGQLVITAHFATGGTVTQRLPFFDI
jgi:hypothetical protein